jgi:hypothetical protein
MIKVNNSISHLFNNIYYFDLVSPIPHKVKPFVQRPPLKRPDNFCRHDTGTNAELLSLERLNRVNGFCSHPKERDS